MVFVTYYNFSFFVLLFSGLILSLTDLVFKRDSIRKAGNVRHYAQVRIKFFRGPINLALYLRVRDYSNMSNEERGARSRGMIGEWMSSEWQMTISLAPTP